MSELPTTGPFPSDRVSGQEFPKRRCTVAAVVADFLIIVVAVVVELAPRAIEKGFPSKR